MDFLPFLMYQIVLNISLRKFQNLRKAILLMFHLFEGSFVCTFVFLDILICIFLFVCTLIKLLLNSCRMNPSEKSSYEKWEIIRKQSWYRNARELLKCLIVALCQAARKGIGEIDINIRIQDPCAFLRTICELYLCCKCTGEIGDY